MKKRFSQDYSPLYFLSALGNGGLAVSFFMYLMFMIKHPDSPIPTFAHISKVITGDNIISSALVILALAAILFFVIRPLYALVLESESFFNIQKNRSICCP